MQWWPLAMSWPAYWGNQPWDTWFWAALPHDDVTCYPYGWYGSYRTEPITYYWFQKISPSGGHREQLAVRSPVTLTSVFGYTIKANVVYILCYEDDTPNWGNTSSLISIAPPCANWNTGLYEVPDEVMRSQTSGLMAAIGGSRDQNIAIRAIVAKDDYENIGILAAIRSEPELPITIKATIRGALERLLPLRAAIRGEQLLEPDIIAAVAKEDNEYPGILATIQKDRFIYDNLKAAILGETERTVGITAVVVKSRADKILLEMENLWPQEFDLRSTPNWASRTKDWRKDNLGS
jgi:hypothetical protein